MHSVYKNANSFTELSLIDPFFFPFPVNLSDFSAIWAYTRVGLYTGSFGSRGFRGAYTRVLVR